MLPKDQKHRPGQLFQDGHHTFKVCLSEFGHDLEIFFCYFGGKQHSSAAPNEGPLQQNLTKVFVICEEQFQDQKRKNLPRGRNLGYPVY